MDALLERHLPALLAWVRLHADPVIRRHESCADVVASVCREVLTERDGFEYRSEPAFRKWLFQKAMSKLVDHKRYFLRARRDPRRALPLGRRTGDSSRGGVEALYAPLCSPSEAASAREEVARFEEAFARLTDDQQQVITASRLLGQSHDEIAAAMGRNAGAVRVLLCRALARVGLLMADAVDRDGTDLGRPADPG